MNKRKRDLILVMIVTLCVGLGYLAYTLLSFNDEASAAYVYFGEYGYLVKVDFEEETIELTKNTNDLSSYQTYIGTTDFPQIEGNYIRLYGDYKVDGQFNLIVIVVNMEKRTMRIAAEESPYHICSNEGESSGKPIVCLPNKIRIEFEFKDQSSGIDI